MSGAAPGRPSKLRQAITLLVALAIFALAAVVIYPKFQARTVGPVRLDLVNGTGASMLEPEMTLEVPADQTVGRMASTIAAGRLVTIYEGMGPVQVGSISFTTGEDGSKVTRAIDRTIEPGGIMVVRVSAEGVVIEASELAAETP